MVDKYVMPHGLAVNVKPKTYDTIEIIKDHHRFFDTGTQFVSYETYLQQIHVREEQINSRDKTIRLQQERVAQLEEEIHKVYATEDVAK